MKSLHTQDQALAYPPAEAEYPPCFSAASIHPSIIKGVSVEKTARISPSYAVFGTGHFAVRFRKLSSWLDVYEPFICPRSFTYLGRSLVVTRFTVSLSPPA